MVLRLRLDMWLIFSLYIQFDFSFSPVFKRLFFFESILLFVCLEIVLLLPPLFKYIIGSILIVVASYYSFSELNKRIGVVNIIKTYGRNK